MSHHGHFVWVSAYKSLQLRMLADRCAFFADFEVFGVCLFPGCGVSGFVAVCGCGASDDCACGVESVDGSCRDALSEDVSEGGCLDGPRDDRRLDCVAGEFIEEDILASSSDEVQY